MSSIRTRMGIMCLVVALLPALPMALVVQSLVDKTFNVGLSEQVEDALKSGVTMSRDAWEGQRARFHGAAVSLFGTLGDAVPDSAAVAAAMARARTAGTEVHGFLVAPYTDAGADTIDARLRPFVSQTTFQKLTAGRALRPERSDTTDALSFFDAADRTLQLAVWTPHAQQRHLLVFRQTDPFFLNHAEQLISARQLFATLRLSRARLTRSFFYAFMIIYGVCVLIALALAFLMAERVATPIRRLSDAAGVVAAGDWDYRLDIRAGGETGRLVDAFNHMVGQLDVQRRRLVDLEKMSAWRDVARHLAHEIKNPLLPIRLTIDELRDQYRGEDGAFRDLLVESTRVVGEEVEHLQRLVREFSEFAKLPELHARPSSLEMLVRDVTALYPHVSTTIVNAPGTPEMFPFDPEQLRRVLVNLYDNAVAVMPSGGTTLRVSMECHASDVVLRVADNGPGIAPEHATRVFEPYFTTRREGTGLGLAMVRNVVLLHGGDVRVERTGTTGTTFTIRLPLAGPPPPKE